MAMQTKKGGFTLVELSIVLVIIGLLIGGILVAQSMIQTAKIENFVRTTQQFNVAVQNFKIKYAALPGDSSDFGCESDENHGSLCDDGNIGPSTFFPNDGDSYFPVFSGESAEFWVDLNDSGFDPKRTFSATIPAGGFDIASSTPNSPALSLEANLGAIAAQCRAGNGLNCFYILNYQGVNAANGIGLGKPAASPATALAIDLKIDDGKSDEGIMLNDKPDTSRNLAIQFGPSCDDGYGNYTVTGSSTPLCNISLQIPSDS